MSKRPDNWYKMTYDEQREWQRREDERQYLINERDDARQQSEEAQQYAARERRATLEARRSMATLADDMTDQLAEVTAQRDELLAACKAVIAFIEKSRQPRMSFEQANAAATALVERITAAIAKVEEQDGR